MSYTVTLELPDALARRARTEAERTDRRLEDVLLSWIDHPAAETPVEAMSDEQVLTLCRLEMAPDQQAELSDLLDLQREGRLADRFHRRLDELMAIYRRDLVRKARALKVAVDRGLAPPLG